MTQLDARPRSCAEANPYETEAAEALIKEARRRKRRRRSIRAGAFAVVAAIGLGLGPFIFGGGGHAASPSRDTNSGPIPFGSCVNCTARSSAKALARGHWVTFPGGPLQPRVGQVGLWTGDQLLVWGGESSNGQSGYQDGATFNATTDRWRLLPKGPLSARANAAAVWTGTVALIWGGSVGAADSPVSGGASYDPSTRTWRRLPTAPLSPRQSADAFWTGRQMIVFGGYALSSVHALPSGATYTPSTKTCTKIPPFPLAGTNGIPISTVAVWMGQQLIAWTSVEQTRTCGLNCHGLMTAELAAAWTPGSSTWQRLSTPPSGVSTSSATAIWTGTHVVLANGSSCPPGASCPAPFGAEGANVYLPGSSRWSSTPRSIVLRGDGPTVWTGRTLLTVDMNDAEIGGTSATVHPGDGAVYDASRKRWIPLPKAPKSDLLSLTDVWTGSSFLLWGEGSSSNVGEVLISK
jgi:hypothetical protein